ncbi:hypothetical protein J4414_02230 [Candidatus Woesearchaeota archaeon]|nr:hypothetical protein [Candidatus Woesearchaeota archaeon]
MNGVWLTIKIYPVCETQDLGKIFSKEVFQCADTYTEELESLSKSNFFLHYTTYRHAPDGPNFTFYAYTEEKEKIYGWKERNENKQFIQRINICEGNENEQIKEGVIAKSLYNKYKLLPTNQIYIQVIQETEY